MPDGEAQSGADAVAADLAGAGWAMGDGQAYKDHLALIAGYPPPATPTNAPATAAATPAGGSSGSTTVTFNDLTGREYALTGQYPSGVIDSGSAGAWWASASWGALTTKNLTFTSPATSATFTLLTPRALVSLKAYNGWSGARTVTLSCSSQPSKTASVPGGSLVTITTGWTGPCSSVTISSSSGDATNFDDLVLSN